MINLDKDQALAEAATQGEWEVHPNPRYYVALPSNCDDKTDFNRNNNAAFVANFDPPHVMEYIAEVRRLRDWQKRASAYVQEMRERMAHLKQYGPNEYKLLVCDGMSLEEAEQLIEEAK